MIACLHKELIARKSELQGQIIETIYVGGGTPSLLHVADLAELIQTIRTEFSCEENIECTLEANPDDITLTNVCAWKKTGVNRLSIGIQSFDAPDLAWMNRAHTAEEGVQCIQIAQAGGITNLSIDLMYGLPDMDSERWLKQIQQAIHLGVQHISAYCLTVEEKTVLDQWVQKNKIQPGSNEQQSEQFEMLISTLHNAGFEHYEISNFAQEGFISKHNSNYWKGVHYLGIGPSAHSFDGHSRAWNISNNLEYIRKIQANAITFEREIITPSNQFNELLLTGLRTKWGVDLNQLAAILPLSKEFYKTLDAFEAQNWAKVTNNHLCLTNTGKHWADRIAQDLFV